MSRIAADDIGIHFLPDEDDIVVAWGEIESVHALWEKMADGTTFLELYIDHVSGVDFRFHSTEAGYEQVMAAMEKHLMGFSRARAEAVGSWEQEQDIPVVWQRDPTVQPFQLRPPPVDVAPREPSQEELRQMEEARRATIATCENLLGRPLAADELACIHIGFENGEITGGIAPPLSETLRRGRA